MSEQKKPEKKPEPPEPELSEHEGEDESPGPYQGVDPDLGSPHDPKEHKERPPALPDHDH